MAVVALTMSSAGISSAAIGGGGFTSPADPTVTDAICLEQCVGLREVTVGGVIQVSGSSMQSVDKVLFAGPDGRISVKPRAVTGTTALAKVPSGAENGKIKVKGEYTGASNASRSVIEIRARTALAAPANLQIAEAEATPRKAYFFGVRRPQLNFIVQSDQRVNRIRVDVVNEGGEVIASIEPDPVPSNSNQTVTWDGRTLAGKPAPSGAYKFRIQAMNGRIARSSAKSKQAGSSLRFEMYGFVFPVRGAHSYGDGLGAGRGHQGQDVMADCGDKLVAARGGKVVFNAYDGRGGNYIVIRGKAAHKDFVYMHLRSRSPLKTGRTVHTGQKIGIVGDTGDATACHLHFEAWSAPGWYNGGKLLNPTPLLKGWDKYS